jgi:protein Tex
MIEFAKQIADKWNIPPALSGIVCDAFQKGDTPYYLAEYRPEITVEIPASCLWEIYDFLGGMSELDSKKKRILNALKKADKLTPVMEKRINVMTSSFELDDMLLPLRPNPRSRGQLAVKKGLEKLADIVMRQEEQSAPIEALAESYIGKDATLKSVDDVLQGVQDVLAERFAYDDTVRVMAREFAYDDGYFEVVPKNKQDPRFSRYVGKQNSLAELTKEEILLLLAAEDEKTVRVKLCVQLFRISELLRHHVIQNPDFSGFDLLCAIINDSWLRLLQPIIERDVKLRLREEAEAWATRRIVPELEKKYAEDQGRGPLCIVDAAHPKQIFFIVVSGRGELCGATSEKKLPDGKVPSYERLRQFYLRHRPSHIVICDNAQAPAAEAAVAQIVQQGDGGQPPVVSRYTADPALRNPSESPWVAKKYEVLLDNDTRKLYGTALLYLTPLELLPFIGTEYYSIHPMQNALTKDCFVRIVNRIVTEAALQRGVPIKDIAESPLAGMAMVTAALVQAIRSAEAQETFTAKNDLLKVPGMTEVVFRNIAGFITIPQADDFRDRSIVHPDHYGWLEEASEQLNVSLDTIAGDPEMLRSFAVDDFVKKIYIEKKLIAQVRSCTRSSASSLQKAKRKLKLTEIKDGSIVSGRVTNITPFGVFVNINAVCDGLIHISQLADEYVESPDQVVALHDKVDVRILKVDAKKRRISLSMKGLGKQGPRVKPSQGQLTTLAEHFKNR